MHLWLPGGQLTHSEQVSSPHEHKTVSMDQRDGHSFGPRTENAAEKGIGKTVESVESHLIFNKRRPRTKLPVVRQFGMREILLRWRPAKPIFSQKSDPRPPGTSETPETMRATLRIMQEV